MSAAVTVGVLGAHTLDRDQVCGCGWRMQPIASALGVSVTYAHHSHVAAELEEAWNTIERGGRPDWIHTTMERSERP